jgi:2'-5' RNA ligase
MLTAASFSSSLSPFAKAMALTTTGASKQTSCKRIFVAIELPNPVRKYCQETITQKLLPLDSLEPTPSVKWILDESMHHCTLQFLGSVNEIVIPDLVQNIRKQCQSIAPMTLSLGKLGCFPHHDRTQNARVIWFGLQGDSQELSNLSKAIMDITESLGLQREKRPFRAHVTLGRVRSASPVLVGRKRRRSPPMSLPFPLQQFIEEGMSTGNIDNGPVNSFQVEHVELIESVLSKQGPTYKTLERFDLLGSQWR